MKKIKKARKPYDIKFTSLIPCDFLIRVDNSISKRFHLELKKTFVKGVARVVQCYIRFPSKP